jgi:hypothetical protein
MAVSRAGVVDGVRLSHALAGTAALATLWAVRGSPLALAAGAVGCVALVAALHWRSRRTVTLAGAVLFGAALLAVAGGAAVGPVLVGAFGAVLAADLGLFALGLDRDVDRSVPTARVELIHAVASATTAVVTAGLGYALYLAVPAGGSAGVVALLLGGVVLVSLLR